MSSAALQCQVLESALRRRAEHGEGVDGLGCEMFPEIAEWVRGPWALAAAGDFEHPDCTGDFPMEALDDLQRLGAAVGDERATDVVLDIAVLRSPLAAIRSVELTAAGGV